MIIASAIKLKDGRVFVGKRHNNCFDNMLKILNLSDVNSVEATKLVDGCIMGFLTDTLGFINREGAYYIAFTSSQCKEQKYDNGFIPETSELFIQEKDWYPCLTSEDLW